MLRVVLITLSCVVVAAVVYGFANDGPSLLTTPEAKRIAVEAEPVEHGTLVKQRSFPGSIEAATEFTLAPKVAGRVEMVMADIGDEVKRGQVLITLDDAEYRQAVAQAQAQLQVAQAQLSEAESGRSLADRRLERVRKLESQGIAPASELDDIESEAASRAASVNLARAQISQARAALEIAQVRLAYTTVQASWSGDDETRFVGQRMVDAGDTVAANTQLLTIVSTQELKVIIQVPQSVYSTLRTGQRANITTPALPNSEFGATVARIAPGFNPGSRQARVELMVENIEQMLAPGMFVQVGVESQRVENASIVPENALVQRSGLQGIFKVNAQDQTAKFVPAQVVLRSGDKLALSGIDDVAGEVVVLGQDQLTEGANVVLAQTIGKSEVPADDAADLAEDIQ